MSTELQSDALATVVQKYWGYDQFRPLQRQAMQSVLEGRDSVVVLPTGGGKSLCFQAPAMCTDGLAIVVSPLISLMKDQIDALTTCGVPAACINSSNSLQERLRVKDEIDAGRLKLLYVAPERLMMDRTLDYLKGVDVSFFAIDEAHCISEWGHNFRPEYRTLSILKSAFPDVALHAYTATATPPVRDDIISQLGLTDPEVLVGSFDRPNLFYKVDRRHDRLNQIDEVLQKHKDESGIIYCISRKNVDEISTALNARGYRTLPYHAGMTDVQRKRHQNAYMKEDVDVIVATVAFGMGIDKSNVRFVIHAGMPKSLEAYQQESGRAGRDGLDATCYLFYSGGDFSLWKKMLEQDLTGDAYDAAIRSLSAMYDFCTSIVCRHRSLVGYFGQTLDASSCKACDVCLGDLDLVDDALVISQKILSCVVRLNQRFGADYTAQVLAGSNDQRILSAGHDQLSTWGLLKSEGKQNVRDWIEQLVAQGYLEKVGEYNILNVSDEGRNLLRGEAAPRLLMPRKKKKSERTQKRVTAGQENDYDHPLFDALKGLRRTIAQRLNVPAYIVFGDAALRDMARKRPSSLSAFREVKGVGEKKAQDFADEFIAFIVKHCKKQGLTMDV
ncbi:MAG: DNA helicase RecQ [Planctomycetota bacterium]|nr:DNA helicase RecQ [Planctomycetota bacterium]MDA1211429.1 DNA helicase RecQ [Planctomycetota bacterium]